jgi:hypothetical protein
MGDRAHVVVVSDDSKVFLYSHWQGSRLPAIVQRALGRKLRWNDEAYLARILFCEMLKAEGAPADESLRAETGFGIASRACEDESRDVVVDVANQTVVLPGKKPVAFDKFITTTVGV